MSQPAFANVSTTLSPTKAKTGYRLIVDEDQTSIVVAGKDGFVYLASSDQKYNISAPWGTINLDADPVNIDVFGRLMGVWEYGVYASITPVLLIPPKQVYSDSIAAQVQPLFLGHHPANSCWPKLLTATPPNRSLSVLESEKAQGKAGVHRRGGRAGPGQQGPGGPPHCPLPDVLQGADGDPVCLPPSHSWTTTASGGCPTSGRRTTSRSSAATTASSRRRLVSGTLARSAVPCASRPRHLCRGLQPRELMSGGEGL